VRPVDDWGYLFSDVIEELTVAPLQSESEEAGDLDVGEGDDTNSEAGSAY
jgi:hypothetical protein